jgi:anti-sigma regulatory factor (Ser/Thr protein kinase)
MDPSMEPTSRVRSTVQLPAELSTPGKARRFAARALQDTTHTGMGDDLALLVSELVTNAVLHADGPITLTVETSRHLVRVEISDNEPELLQLPATRDAEHGRGLPIVERIAHAWGADPLIDDGKMVWAELRDPHAD